MKKRIIYTRPDGGVSIIVPANQADVANSVPKVAKMTEAQFLDYLIAKDVPEGASNIRVVNDTDIPSDRSNRNAWRMQDFLRQAL